MSEGFWPLGAAIGGDLFAALRSNMFLSDDISSIDEESTAPFPGLAERLCSGVMLCRGGAPSATSPLPSGPSWNSFLRSFTDGGSSSGMASLD